MMRIMCLFGGGRLGEVLTHSGTWTEGQHHRTRWVLESTGWSEGLGTTFWQPRKSVVSGKWKVEKCDQEAYIQGRLAGVNVSRSRREC